MLSNIPRSFDAVDEDYSQDLREFLEKGILPGESVQVANINLCYNIGSALKLQKEKLKLLRQKARVLNYRHHHGYYQPGQTLLMINRSITLIDS